MKHKRRNVKLWIIFRIVKFFLKKVSSVSQNEPKLRNCAIFFTFLHFSLFKTNVTLQDWINTTEKQNTILAKNNWFLQRCLQLKFCDGLEWTRSRHFVILFFFALQTKFVIAHPAYFNTKWFIIKIAWKFSPNFWNWVFLMSKISYFLEFFSEVAGSCYSVYVFLATSVN